MLEQAVHAQLDAGGHQVVEVRVRAGYRPGAILAQAGIPLRIIFRREDDDVRTERIVFSAPRLERRLAPTGTTTIDLPPQPAGVIRFTCGMGRYSGHIELVDGRTRPVLAQIRDHSSRLAGHHWMSRVFWISSIPLVAALAVLTLDATAALSLAVVVLIASVAGCLLASRSSTRPT